jgi:hypothetical protein
MNWQDGYPGELIVWFLSKFKELQIRRVWDVVPDRIWKPDNQDCLWFHDENQQAGDPRGADISVQVKRQKQNQCSLSKAIRHK